MELTSATAHSFHCPRWSELPSIPLYMDQVIIILEDAIGLFSEGEERVLTSTMINNYVKQKLLSPPVKKKYGRQHLASLIIVTLLKRVLSIAETAELLKLLLDTYGAERSYDLFCESLEQALTGMFSKGFASSSPTPFEKSTDNALHAALMALMGKLFLQQCLKQYIVE